MQRPPMDDPFNPIPGYCDACGHPPHPNGDCPYHYPLDLCPGYRTVKLSREVVDESFRRMEPMMAAERRARAFFAKDFSYLKEQEG